jgi:hypothetical protein
MNSSKLFVLSRLPTLNPTCMTQADAVYLSSAPRITGKPPTHLSRSNHESCALRSERDCVGFQECVSGNVKPQWTRLRKRRSCAPRAPRRSRRSQRLRRSRKPWWSRGPRWPRWDTWRRGGGVLPETPSDPCLYSIGFDTQKTWHSTSRASSESTTPYFSQTCSPRSWARRPDFPVDCARRGYPQPRGRRRWPLSVNKMVALDVLNGRCSVRAKVAEDFAFIFNETVSSGHWRRSCKLGIAPRR